MDRRRDMNPVVERSSVEALRAVQEKRALEQVIRMYETNEFYADYYRRQRFDPYKLRSLEDFKHRVPFVTKEILLEDQRNNPPFGRMNSKPDVVRQLHFTSGTTGVGQEMHPLTARDVEALGTANMYHWHWAGLRSGDRLVITFPVGLTMAGQFFIKSCEALGVVPLLVGGASAEEKIRLMLKVKPTGLIAGPSYLERLRSVATEMDVDPARDLPDLTCIFTAAEPFSLEWAVDTEQFWRAKVHEWYGATQSAGQAMFTCEHGAVNDDGAGTLSRGYLHNLDHRNLVEVLSVDDDGVRGETPVPVGSPGEAVITNLHRRGFACVRFRIGDRVVPLGANVCSCGRPFANFESGTITRYDDMMKIKGMNVWPAAVDEIVLRDAEVAEYLGHVFLGEDGREVAEILVELNPQVEGSTDSIIARLSGQLRDLIGVGFVIRIAPPLSLPRYEFKARRWTDDRQSGRNRVQYTEKPL